MAQVQKVRNAKRIAPVEAAASASAPVLYQMIGKMINQLAKLSGEPINTTGERALRKALGRGMAWLRVVHSGAGSAEALTLDQPNNYMNPILRS